MDTKVTERDFSQEFVFRTSRSSGSGGQNVNKVSTKVELIFNIKSSLLLDENEKELLAVSLKNRIRSDGAIHLVCQDARSQPANKKKVIIRFYKLLEKALKPSKKRIPIEISPEAEEKLRQRKILLSRKKELRRKPGIIE